MSNYNPQRVGQVSDGLSSVESPPIASNTERPRSGQLSAYVSNSASHQTSHLPRSFTDPFQTAASLLRFDDQARVAQPGQGRRGEHGIISGGRVIPSSSLSAMSLPLIALQSATPVHQTGHPQTMSSLHQTLAQPTRQRHPSPVAGISGAQSNSSREEDSPSIVHPSANSATNNSMHLLRTAQTVRLATDSGVVNSPTNVNASNSLMPNPIRRTLKRKTPTTFIPPTMARVTLNKEALEMKVECAPGCYASPKLNEPQLLEWAVVIEGPENTPYEGGTFFVHLVASEEHPIFPPKATFLTRIYHCNVSRNGDISRSIISDKWRHGHKMSNAIHALRQMLASPNPDDPMNKALADEYKLKRQKYEETARIWTERYAR